MNRNVQLTLTGQQRTEGNDETTTGLSAAAEYYERNGSCYILYEETTEDGGEVKTRIKLKNERLEVTKKGAVNTCMIFEPKTEQKARYATPFGILQMDIYTHSVESIQSDNQLTVTADYALTENGREISQCKISIKIQDRV